MNKILLFLISSPLFVLGQNVGIGTTNPIGRLDIVGTGTNSTTNTFLLRNSSGDTIMRVRDDGRMGINYNGPSYGRIMNLGGSGINFYTANEVAFGGSVFPTDTSLVIWSNSNSNNYLVLQPSWGNTGVGTYTPNAKFHVNGATLMGGNSDRIATGYLLSVAGKAIATEFRVLAVASWPDYVFSKDYKLMPIEDVEKYIDTNKHLLNIPSAAEVEKDGIALGDMSKRLMEKIEELTLYIIDLNKKNNVLTKKVEFLEKTLTEAK